jgi:hypothetical protein
MWKEMKRKENNLSSIKPPFDGGGGDGENDE